MTALAKTSKQRGRPKGQSKSEIQVVSYLNHPVLVGLLDDLIRRGEIGHYWAVEHACDEDDCKVHSHLRMLPPPGRCVDWHAILSTLQEQVAGEPLPRCCVASSRACNNQGLDGLLYARHDRRYCDIKGLSKSRYDYQFEDFATDSKDWFRQLWQASDSYTPTRQRLTSEGLLEHIESNPNITELELLRLCICNGLSKGQFDMLRRYASCYRAQQEQASSQTQKQQNHQECHENKAFEFDNKPEFSEFPFSSVDPLLEEADRWPLGGYFDPSSPFRG